MGLRLDRRAGRELTALRPAAHALSALAALGLLPVAGVALLARRSWRIGVPERLGLQPRRAPGAIWVHAASVGEILAATRLVDALAAEGHAVVTSTVTPGGREVMRRQRPDVPCHLAPLDHPWCVQAALARVRPAALVLVETELVAMLDRGGPRPWHPGGAGLGPGFGSLLSALPEPRVDHRADAREAVRDRRALLRVGALGEKAVIETPDANSTLVKRTDQLFGAGRKATQDDLREAQSRNLPGGSS